MGRVSYAVVIALGGLAGCTENRIAGASGTGRSPWEFLALLLAAGLLYLAFSGLAALLSRRVLRTGDSFDLESRRSQPRPKRQPPDRNADRGASTSDASASTPTPLVGVRRGNEGSGR